MGFLAWIIIGGIAGWVASLIMKTREGILLNIVVGIVGGLLGGWLLGVLGMDMAGAGVILEGEAGFEDDAVKFDYDVGAAWGIGAEVGFEFEINVVEAGQEVARIGQDAIYAIF